MLRCGVVHEPARLWWTQRRGRGLRTRARVGAAAKYQLGPGLRQGHGAWALHASAAGLCVRTDVRPHDSGPATWWGTTEGLLHAAPLLLPKKKILLTERNKICFYK